MSSNDTIPSHVSHETRTERSLLRAPARHSPVRLVAEGGVPVGAPPAFTPKKKFVAKGHDAQLEGAQYGGNKVRLALVAGDKVYGRVERRDKFTVTLRHDIGDHEASGLTEIFYKHAIEGVLVFPNRDSQE